MDVQHIHGVTAPFIEKMIFLHCTVPLSKSSGHGSVHLRLGSPAFCSLDLFVAFLHQNHTALITVVS
jgi:hypothetical protein